MMTDDFDDLTQKAVMFGDGGKYKHMQVYAVFYKSKSTGITMTAVKPHHGDWKVTIHVAGTDYTSREAAVHAWVEAGRPVVSEEKAP